MKMQECPRTDRLQSYTLGTLVDSEYDEMMGHVRDCATCLLELKLMDEHDAFGDSLLGLLKTGMERIDFDSEPQCRLAVRKANSVFYDRSRESDFESASPGKKMGDYEIIRLLGYGGMGSVYLAKHAKLGREVAIKILARHRWMDPRMRERFALEMHAVGTLSHPNIVTAYDAREIDGMTVLVTEYIDGLDLGKVIERMGRLSIPDACKVAATVARALAYTDQRGFVHRDIKPSNIMLSSNGIVKLLDLGLARIVFAGSDLSELTVTGQAMGSPDYVAPEQINDGRAVDVRSDLYSLGCTLFKILSGQNVICDDQFASAFAKMTAHVSVAAPSLKLVRPDSDDRLVRLVDSMLCKDPSHRPQTPNEVIDVLDLVAKDSDLKTLIEKALNASDARTSQSNPNSVVKRAIVKKTKPIRQKTYGQSQKTKEEFIEESQRANPEFLYGILLPKRIARQPFTHGFGASQLVNGDWVSAPAF